jgi:hypothetical protein
MDAAWKSQYISHSMCNYSKWSTARSCLMVLWFLNAAKSDTAFNLGFWHPEVVIMALEWFQDWQLTYWMCHSRSRQHQQRWPPNGRIRHVMDRPRLQRIIQDCSNSMILHKLRIQGIMTCNRHIFQHLWTRANRRVKALLVSKSFRRGKFTVSMKARLRPLLLQGEVIVFLSSLVTQIGGSCMTRGGH